jgi:guanylate kinase
VSKGPLIVLSGPSGSGKSTIVDYLLRQTGWPLRLSVSVTTRPPRGNEQEGIHYYFWDRERFFKERDADSFLEWADVYGNYYGTLRREIEPHREKGTGVLLDIDVKGWMQVKRQCPDAVSIFVRAPSLEVYEQRLRERGTDSEPVIQRRLQAAQAEESQRHEYQHEVVNDQLQATLENIHRIVKPLFERNE